MLFDSRVSRKDKLPEKEPLEHEHEYLKITDRVPAEAVPDCEQSILISRIAGEKAFVNDICGKSPVVGHDVGCGEGHGGTDYISY